MNQNEVYDLIGKFEDSSLTVLEIKDGEFSVHMEKDGQRMQMTEQTLVNPQQGDRSQGEDKAKPVDNDFVLVKAPLVGVFYEANSPEALPFVKVGDRVEKGQVLCLIEAMKMMNELKSPVSGILRKALGVNGELVEYDQVIFEVEPC